MAIKKSCDFCDEVLNRENKPFLQLHGSLSEQIEDGKGTTMFRYLTNYYQNKLAFCDVDCLVKWINQQCSVRPFKQQPQEEVEGPVIHT